MPEMSPLLLTVLTGLRQAIDRLDEKVERLDEKVTENMSKEREKNDALASRVDRLYTMGSLAIFALPFLWSLVVDYLKSFFAGAKG